jgi:hypothetical protein
MGTWGHNLFQAISLPTFMPIRTLFYKPSDKTFSSMMNTIQKSWPITRSLDQHTDNFSLIIITVVSIYIKCKCKCKYKCKTINQSRIWSNLKILHKMSLKIGIRIGDAMGGKNIMDVLTMMKIIKKVRLIMAMGMVITDMAINATIMEMAENKSLEIKNGTIKIITKNTNTTKNVSIQVHPTSLIIASTKIDTKRNKKFTEKKKATNQTS